MIPKIGLCRLRASARFFCSAYAYVFAFLFSLCAWAEGTYILPVNVTSEQPCPNVPIDPIIDFEAIIENAGLSGVLDPNSIEVVNVETGDPIPHALSEAFAHGDKGRVEWVAAEPSWRSFEIRFKTTSTRPPLIAPSRVPMIGTGDLLRYNAGEPRPIVLPYCSGLTDLTGDGLPDLVGCWNYAYRPGEPWDGIVCYPGVPSEAGFLFGDLTHVRSKESADSDADVISRRYMFADFDDVNGDGLVDFAYRANSSNTVSFYLNTGHREAEGMPEFVLGLRFDSPSDEKAQNSFRLVDLDDDGKVDVIAGSYYVPNVGDSGWPFVAGPPVLLDAGGTPDFCDVDGDGAKDAVRLVADGSGDVQSYVVRWRKNLGGNPPRFGANQLIPGVNTGRSDFVCATVINGQSGLIIFHDVYTRLTFFARAELADGGFEFRPSGDALSNSAVMSLSDQAWPYVCDWEGDGDTDLLIGGGYGWPRTVVNGGTTAQPRFAEPEPIFSEGKSVRILRDEILGGSNWHNMGYSYPAYVDWDSDGLPDLMLPNETNRIMWFKNVGTRSEPRFGPMLQVLCDGYPDSPELRAESATLAGDKDVPNSPYPYQENQPFFWRTGAAFGDFNGDGFMDMATHDGAARKLTLFSQYRSESGELRLRKERGLALSDGRPIDDAIVERTAHWTESFKCVDWDKDGLLDLMYSLSGVESGKSSIHLLRNCGTKADPVFENPKPMRCFGEPINITAHGPHPYAGDVDGDGFPDILACVEWSVYPFYSYAALTMTERPNLAIGSVRVEGK
ncbi:MAG: VCBS repeat-containing protein [Candidatus Hydrogenedentales bacterium]